MSLLADSQFTAQLLLFLTVMASHSLKIDTRPCTPHWVTIAPACYDLAVGDGWAWVAWCLSGVRHRGLASRETWNQIWHYKYTAQSSHRHKTCTVTMTVAAHHPYIQTPLHTRGCALGRYENWPQYWLWIVIPASASMVTPKEHKHESP